MFIRMSLAQRLFSINATLIGLLIIVSITVWFMMGKVIDAAERISKTNVPQLELIAELELNVTRASLQVRHAILSRSPQELQATLDDVAAKKELLNEKLVAFGKGMIDEEWASPSFPDTSNDMMCSGDRHDKNPKELHGRVQT